MFNNDQNFNNNMNNNFNNISNSSNNNNDLFNEQPSFTNNFPPNLGQEFINQPGVDIPPKLDEIKPLSDATVSVAPTMDALDPMNVMPESLPQNNDRLDAYENGNINIPTNVNNNLNQEFTASNPSLVNQNTNNFNMPQTPQSQIPSDFNNNLGNTYMMPNQNLVGGVDTQNNFGFPETPLVNNFNLNTPVEGSNDFINNPVSNLENAPLVNELNQQNLSNENNAMESIPSAVQVQEQTLSNDYNIVQNSNLNENQPLTNEDLGLNTNPSDSDMLEIMDDIKEENVSNISPQAALQELKDIVDKYKNLGIKINVQEFDFDKLYQLIIKIDK